MTAIFRINQPGITPPKPPTGTWDRARQDLELFARGGTVEFEAQDVMSSYKWELYSQPAGITETVNSSTSQTATVDFGSTGPFLMRLTVDEGLPTEEVSVRYVGLPLPSSQLPIPALDELNFDNSQTPYDGSRGAADKLEAWFRWLDEKVGVSPRQRAVIDFETDPSGLSPSAGDRWIVGSGAVGVWAGKDNDIAEWDGIDWLYATPEEGWITYVDALDVDYRFIDDGVPTWEEVKGGIFDVGVGLLSAERQDAGLTTAAAYAFNMGSGNTINAGSDFAVAFGAGNVVGSRADAPYAFVYGRDNLVDGPVTPEWVNFVVGQEHDIQGDQQTVLGGIENITDNLSGVNWIFGGANVLTGSGLNHVLGFNHTLTTSALCTVLGDENTLTDGASAFVQGDLNEIGAGDSSGCGYAAVMGYNNLVGITNDAYHSRVFGDSNEVDSPKCFVSGTGNIVGTGCTGTFIHGGQYPEYGVPFDFPNIVGDGSNGVLYGVGHEIGAGGSTAFTFGWFNKFGLTSPSTATHCFGLNCEVDGSEWGWIHGESNKIVGVSANDYTHLFGSFNQVGLQTEVAPNTTIFGHKCTVYDTTSYVGRVADGGNFIVSLLENGRLNLSGSALNVAASPILYVDEPIQYIPQKGIAEIAGDFYEYSSWTNSGATAPNGEFTLVSTLQSTYTDGDDVDAGALDINSSAIFGSYNVLNRVGGGFVVGAYNVIEDGGGTVTGSSVLGGFCHVTGDFNFMGGAFHEVTGAWNFVSGDSIEVSGDYNAVLFGGGHQQGGNFTVLGGDTVVSDAWYSVLFGDTIAVGDNGFINAHGADLTIGDSPYGVHRVMGINTTVGDDNTALDIFGSNHSISDENGFIRAFGDSHVFVAGNFAADVFGGGNQMPGPSYVNQLFAFGSEVAEGGWYNYVHGSGHTISAFCGSNFVVGGSEDGVSPVPGVPVQLGNTLGLSFAMTAAQAISGHTTIYVDSPIDGSMPASGRIFIDGDEYAFTSWTNAGATAPNGEFTLNSSLTTTYSVGALVFAGTFVTNAYVYGSENEVGVGEAGPGVPIDFNMVYGVSNTIAGSAAMTFGGGNLTSPGSGFSFTFGDGCAVGPECFISTQFGDGNTIGDVAPSLANFIHGIGNTIHEGEFSAVWGVDNEMSGVFSWVWGDTNFVEASPYVQIFGEGFYLPADTEMSRFFGSSGGTGSESGKSVAYADVFGDGCGVDKYGYHDRVSGKANVANAGSAYNQIYGHTNSIGALSHQNFTMGGMDDGGPLSDMYGMAPTLGNQIGNAFYYTGDGNNNLADPDITVNESIDVSTPSAGLIYIDGDEYRYASWAGSTFTLKSGQTLSQTYSADVDVFAGTFANTCFAFGWENQISTAGHEDVEWGEASFVFGNYNQAQGPFSFLYGDGNEVVPLSGMSFLWGINNFVDPDCFFNVAMGEENEIGASGPAEFSYLFGSGNIIEAGEFNFVGGDSNSVLGVFDFIYGVNNTVSATGTAFVFGEDHIVGLGGYAQNHYSATFGRGNELDGFWFGLDDDAMHQTVFGRGNFDAAPYTFVSGQANEVGLGNMAGFAHGVENVIGTSQAYTAAPGNTAGNSTLLAKENQAANVPGKVTIGGDTYYYSAAAWDSKALVFVFSGLDRVLDTTYAEDSLIAAGLYGDGNYTVGMNNELYGEVGTIIGRENQVGAYGGSVVNVVMGGSYDNFPWDLGTPYPGNIIGASAPSYVCGAFGTDNQIDDQFVGFSAFSYVFGLSNTVGVTAGTAGLGDMVFGAFNDVGTIDGGAMRFTFGQLNTVHGSESCVLFGWNSTIDMTGGPLYTQHAYCFGENHDITEGYNFVAGQGHDVSGYGNTVMGGVDGATGSVVSGVQNSVLGNGHTIGGNYNTIGGVGHTAPSGSNYNMIGGDSHTIDGSYNLIAGQLHNFTGNFYQNLIVGYGHSETTGSGIVGNSVIGGYDHTISGDCHTNAIFGNTHSLTGSTTGNLISGSSHIIPVASNYNVIGGNDHTLIPGMGGISHCAIFGYNHDLTEPNYSLIAGSNHTVASNYVAVFGTDHDVADAYCAVFGNLAKTRWAYGIYNSSGPIAGTAAGDAQNVLNVPMKAETNDAAWTEVFVGGSVGSRLSIEVSSSILFIFEGTATRRDVEGHVKSWLAYATLQRNSGGTVSLVGTPSYTELDDSGENYDIRLTADDTNKSLKVEVLGDSSDEVYWNFSVKAVETLTVN